jgi:serine kinase of HPr protein (carbohydrate metabolism regulator)
MAEARLVHASCVACRGRAILIIGPSGSGKSDLALRLIDRGARLVSDDQTLVTLENGRLLASPPRTIQGLVEVRGLGLRTTEWEAQVPLALAIELGAEVARYPLEPRVLTVSGIDLPLVRLDGFHASTPLKVEFALADVTQ